jgi:hypothetical protein
MAIESRVQYLSPHTMAPVRKSLLPNDSSCAKIARSLSNSVARSTTFIEISDLGRRNRSQPNAGSPVLVCGLSSYQDVGGVAKNRAWVVNKVKALQTLQLKPHLELPPTILYK